MRTDSQSSLRRIHIGKAFFDSGLFIRVSIKKEQKNEKCAIKSLYLGEHGSRQTKYLISSVFRYSFESHSIYNRVSEELRCPTMIV